MDAVLQVVSTDGFVLAQNDDDVGRDPRIVFEAPAAGTYIVRLFAFPATPDSSIRFAGGSAFVYRLTLTTGGFLDYAFPLAVGRDGPAVVEAIGWNIPADCRDLPIAGIGRARRVHRVPRFAGRIRPWSVGSRSPRRSRPSPTIRRGLRRSRAPSPSAAGSTRRATRTSSASRCEKGDKRVFRVESRALGRPLDPVLRVLDAGGKILAESDDTGRNNRDLERSFTAPADGEYRLVVRDLNGRGGPRFAYLLSVLEPRPDFALSLASDRFDLTPGKTTKIAVAVQREGRPGGAHRDRRRGPSGRRHGAAGDIEARGCLGPLGGARAIGRRIARVPAHFASSAGRRGSLARLHTATAAIAGFDARTDQPWLTIRGTEPVNQK